MIFFVVFTSYYILYISHSDLVYSVYFILHLVYLMVTVPIAGFLWFL